MKLSLTASSNSISIKEWFFTDVGGYILVAREQH